MNILYPFQVIYDLIVSILMYFINMMTPNRECPRKIRWNDEKNTIHVTYSKDEYDRTMIKRERFNVLPFNQI